MLEYHHGYLDDVNVIKITDSLLEVSVYFMTPGTNPSFRSYKKIRIYSYQNINEERKYRYPKIIV